MSVNNIRFNGLFVLLDRGGDSSSQSPRFRDLLDDLRSRQVTLEEHGSGTSIVYAGTNTPAGDQIVLQAVRRHGQRILYFPELKVPDIPTLKARMNVSLLQSLLALAGIGREQ